MIIWQLIQLISLFPVATYASQFESDPKGLKMAAIDQYDGRHDLVSNEFMESVNSEEEQIFAYMGLLDIIEFISEEALKRKNKAAFATAWISAIYDMAKETYINQVYEDMGTDSNDEFDIEKLKRDQDRILQTGFKQSFVDIVVSSSSSASPESSDHELEPRNDAGIGELNVFDFIKSKVFGEGDAADDKDEEKDHKSNQKVTSENDNSEIEVSDNEIPAADSKEEPSDRIEAIRRSFDSTSEEADQFVVTREPFRDFNEKKDISHPRARGPRGLLNGNNIAASLMANAALENPQKEATFQISDEAMSMYNEPNCDAIAGFDTATLMDQLQQQIMTQLMAQLAEKHPQAAQLATLAQHERNIFEGAMGNDGDGLPEINQHTVSTCLRTSSLPKLLNSLIKGRTGIDVLKSLAMVLKVLNEALGVAEVVLKMLIRIVKAVRYYSLCISDIVADMAREDNLTPIVDLSVPIDSVPMAKKSGGGGFKMKKLTSMFRKSKMSSSKSKPAAAEHEMSPFTDGIHAALCKLRDYSFDFQKLPPTLLLRLFHTIFAELEKRKGIIRVALTRKKHKTLIALQEEINDAIEAIYAAIKAVDEEAYENLERVNTMIITDILISLISPVKLEPTVVEAHIAQVTSWIKPLMVIMDQDSQLSILNFWLTDPHAEQFFRRSQGIPETSAEATASAAMSPTSSMCAKQFRCSIPRASNTRK